MSPRSVRVVALVAAVECAGLSCFEVLLALGAPLGRAAFGGTTAVLPAGLRVASAVSALVFLAAIYVVLSRAGVIGGSSHSAVVRVGIWVFAVIFGLSTLANIASSSPWERFLLAPIALVLVVCCVVVARSNLSMKT